MTATATFRCSCGDEFPVWPMLGEHQTETKHEGMWTGEATVDGQRANIVHDQAPPLVEVEVTDESVLGNLARAMESEAALRTAANTAKNALAHAVKKTKAAAEFAAHHWAQSRQMTMNLTSGGTDPDDDEGDEA